MKIGNIKNSLYLVQNNNVSFKRSLKEHKSWGANYDSENKQTTFKILTYPDVKDAYVNVVDNKSKKVSTYPLNNKTQGVFESEKIASPQAKPNDKYFYTLVKYDGRKIDHLKDPYSFKQDEFLGSSTIYDQSQYNWQDESWFKTSTHRVSRLANQKNRLTKVNALRIYELNIATLTKKGNFSEAKKELKRIKNLGFNAIEIMPVENTYSFNWGYDGVDKLAVSKYLGGPDELKSFIDMAHKLNLNVVMDMVPNHIGPDGSIMEAFGPFVKANNAFGQAFNYEGDNSKYVRDYMVNCALNWVQNYHCDGLRLDMTKFCDSDLLLKQIASELNYHNPDVFLIAEDSRNHVRSDGFNRWDDNNITHDERVIQRLNDYEIALNQNEQNHNYVIEQMPFVNDNYARLGYDSEWDFPYFHTLEELRDFNWETSSESQRQQMMDKLFNAMITSQSRVKYVMSHDEIGNNTGTRLIPKVLTRILNLRDKVYLDDGDWFRIDQLSKKMPKDQAVNMVCWQKADLAGEKLAKIVDNGEIEHYVYNNQNFERDILKRFGIRQDAFIYPQDIINVYNFAYNKNKALYSLNYAIPGIKMVFQGDERADLTSFRFFREFKNQENEADLYSEKGYKPGLDALLKSKLDFSKTNNLMSSFEKLSKDLNELSDKNKALKEGRLVEAKSIKHPISGVIGLNIKCEEDEFFVVSNMSNSTFTNNEYMIDFPKGTWVEALNTDNKKYLGSNNINENEIVSDGCNKSGISISTNSTIYFKKIK